MSQITSIEPQKKQKDRFNIYLDNHFAFGIDENVLVKNSLKIGQNLTSTQIEKIVKEIELGKLTDQALRFLSYRPRSEREVANYLIKKISQKENIKFSLAKESLLIAKVIEKLKKYQYLNDAEFAKWLVQSRTKSSPRGTNLIKSELIKKGISKAIIEKTLASLPNQTQQAVKALEKKFQKWQKLSPLDQKKKIYSYLASRGFDYDTIYEAFAFFKKRR